MTTTSRMSSARSSRIVLLFIIANAVLWAIFWGGFFSESSAYPQLQTPGEGAYVSQVIAHRAVLHDLAPNRDTYYQVSFIPNFPSFILTRTAFNVLLRGYRSPDLYFGTTVAGYELICWMLVSFLQWYFIASILKRLLVKRQNKRELNTSV
jgi:hypothetical protein